jgi:hypothetical protein
MIGKVFEQPVSEGSHMKPIRALGIILFVGGAILLINGIVEIFQGIGRLASLSSGFVALFLGFLCYNKK